uniref:Ig-like domain-containing protein n=1 Tax=Sinocyclocheilus grahami TaxID=75366 RepID=A0A672R775_SINGR
MRGWAKASGLPKKFDLSGYSCSLMTSPGGHASGVNPAASVYPTPTPPVFIRKMRNAAVGTGCDIRLKVAVAGDPQPTLYWYHNDDLLNMDNQEYGGLWIRDCKPSDAGLYTCIATNNLGEARSSAVLAVLDLGEGNYECSFKCKYNTNVSF